MEQIISSSFILTQFHAMKASIPQPRFFQRAFTLIETLVVVSIIVLILVMTAPSLFSTMQATRLTAAGETVLGFLSEAQQVAQSQNTPVEVRFFRYQTALSPFQAFRSMQMFKITNPVDAGGQIQERSEPIGTLVRLPDNVIIPQDDTDLSPLLEGDGFEDVKPTGSGSYSGVEDAYYCAVRFMTDGSCRKVEASGSGAAASSLSYPELRQSCITVCPDINQEVKVDNLPKNFFCIQIDPYTGKIHTYRPGQF